jgi:hypothetical protein
VRRIIFDIVSFLDERVTVLITKPFVAIMPGSLASIRSFGIDDARTFRGAETIVTPLNCRLLVETVERS